METKIPTGSKMKKTARDIMTRPVITAKEEMSLVDVIGLLSLWRINGIPVVDADEKLVGMITEHDVVNFTLSGTASDTMVREVMTKEVNTIAPDIPFEEIINSYAVFHKANKTFRMIIVEDEKVIGIISRRDILREMNLIYSKF